MSFFFIKKILKFFKIEVYFFEIINTEKVIKILVGNY